MVETKNIFSENENNLTNQANLHSNITISKQIQKTLEAAEIWFFAWTGKKKNKVVSKKAKYVQCLIDKPCKIQACFFTM